jgi:hypothetical protein
MIAVKPVYVEDGSGEDKDCVEDDDVKNGGDEDGVKDDGGGEDSIVDYGEGGIQDDGCEDGVEDDV